MVLISPPFTFLVLLFTLLFPPSFPSASPPKIFIPCPNCVGNSVFLWYKQLLFLKEKGREGEWGEWVERGEGEGGDVGVVGFGGVGRGGEGERGEGGFFVGKEDGGVCFWGLGGGRVERQWERQLGSEQEGGEKGEGGEKSEKEEEREKVCSFVLFSCLEIVLLVFENGKIILWDLNSRSLLGVGGVEMREGESREENETKNENGEEGMIIFALGVEINSRFAFLFILSSCYFILTMHNILSSKKKTDRQDEKKRGFSG